MIDKIINSLSFVEMILQQVNAPRMYQPFFKTMTQKDHETLQAIYEKLSVLSLISLNLEVDSNEKKECEAIKTIVETWNSVKPQFSIILEHIRNPPSPEAKKEKSYFG